MEALKALTHRYVKEDSGDATVSPDDVAAYLAGIESFGDDETLIQRIGQQPDWVLPTETRALVQGIDDCSKLIFKLVELEDSIETRLRSVMPTLAAKMIEDPTLPLSNKTTILTVLDALAEALVGWIPDLGSAGNKLIDKLDESLNSIRQGVDLRSVLTDIQAFLDKESTRVSKLEQRMAASETGLVRSQQAKNLAANMINETANGKMVTETLQAFLTGPWNDSIQLLVNHHGVESEQWQRADKLTETILWTYQPVESGASGAEQKQKLYRIVEHLPDEIRELLVALAHNTEGAEKAISGIETDHVTLVSGMSLELAPFQPIPAKAPATSGSKVSRRLLTKVQAMKPGQWFIYEENEKIVRIKLVLKLDDVHQLLFTNRNGMKVLQKSYDEFAYYLASHAVKPLSHQSVFSSTFRTYFEGLIDEYRKYQTQIRERQAEKAAIERLDEEREADHRKALEEAEHDALAREASEQAQLETLKLARLEHARVEAEKAENQGRLTEFRKRVASLNTGAFLKLPGADGQPIECKLAVKITAADKLIFVSRAGTKVGEYKSEELVQLLVAGQGEISNAGVEFEDTLAKVVTKLRQDRTKSYDDLTGS